MARNTLEFGFRVVGLDKATEEAKNFETVLRSINKKREETLHLSREEAEKEAELFESKLIAMKKTLSFADNLNRKLNEQRDINSNLQALEKMRQVQQALGNKKNVADLDEQIKFLNDNYNLLEQELSIIKEIGKAEEELSKQRKRDFEESEYRRQKANEYRDNFRKGGLFAGLKSISFSKVTNDEFNHLISTNDNIIKENLQEIENLKTDILKGGPDVDIEAAKSKISRLESDNRARQSKNASLSTEQMIMNTAINGIKKFGQIATGVFKTMGIDLKAIWADVLSNIKSTLAENGIASFNTGSTLFTNSTARAQQMKYGLSNSANYALTQTMDMLNMKSDEDLMYMNQNQKEIFNDLMDRYRGWYEQLESTGAMVKLQQAQLEFKMFKQELSMKLLNWFAEHKEAIFKILELVMGFLEVIANVVEAILDLIPWGDKSSSSLIGTSDNYSSNTNSNININVNNTNNASANLNSKAELDNSLNAANANLVKSIAANLTSR